MPGRRPLDTDTLLSSDETEALLALLSDISQGHGGDPGVRDAAGAAWSLLGNRAAAQSGFAPARDDGYFEQLLGRMLNRPGPGVLTNDCGTAPIRSGVASERFADRAGRGRSGGRIGAWRPLRVGTVVRVRIG